MEAKPCEVSSIYHSHYNLKEKEQTDLKKILLPPGTYAVLSHFSIDGIKKNYNLRLFWLLPNVN